MASHECACMRDMHLPQERITTDGRLATAGAAYQTLQRQQQQQHHQHHNQQQQEQQEQQTPPVHSEPQRPPGLAAAAPLAPPVAAAELDALAELVRSSDRVLVITGAGCSTESNVPDYRGPSGCVHAGRADGQRQSTHTMPNTRHAFLNAILASRGFDVHAPR
jgi:hypothetical protein